MARPSLWNNPYVAGFLGILATGLGHVYLRRWLRAFGWLALAVGVSILFVPDSAAVAVLEGGDVEPIEVLPAVAVTAVSAIDAYLLARRSRTTAGSGAGAGDAEKPTCPYCGGDVEPDLGFCHWCTREFDVDGGGSPVARDA